MVTSMVTWWLLSVLPSGHMLSSAAPELLRTQQVVCEVCHTTEGCKGNCHASVAVRHVRVLLKPIDEPSCIACRRQAAVTPM
jgi:hypothetical protein